jgi:hypothetical protein
MAQSVNGALAFFKGANQKLVEGETDTKVCAEQVAMEKMHRNRDDSGGAFNYIPAIFVSGPVQPDTHSGLVTPTLHSCGIDRAIMWDEPTIDEDTLIVSVHPDKDIYEVNTHFELQTMHALPGNITPYSVEDPGFATWRNVGPVYERSLEAIRAGGGEPSKALIARLAVTGRLQPQPLP